MKKHISLLTVLGGLALLIAGAVILSSCEGPMGPQGPAGQDGQDGVDGIDGVDGTDGTDGVAGNAVCMECHTTAVKAAVTAQYELSTHASASTLSRASRVGCAKCHGHEGFVETVWTGLDTTAAAVPLPQRIQCKTCHDFHSSLDFENEANSAIRTTEAVKFMTSGEAEFANEESNLCLNCHQARRSPPSDADGSAITEVGGHYGPHHSPQGNVLNGMLGYEFGAALSTSGAHESMASCVYCHMPESAADTLGGHTWKPAIEGCVACHAGATDFDINGTVTEIAGLMDDLKTALMTAGMLDAEGHAVEDVSYQADSVGALWNYILIMEDQSEGIHNPAYTKALLTNSIAKLQ